MMNWELATENEIRHNLNQSALQAIAKIIESKTEDEETTGFIKYQRICGVMATLEEIVDDMLETAAKLQAEKDEFAESCKAAGEAFDNLFNRKTWKTEVMDDGTAT